MKGRAVLDLVDLDVNEWDLYGLLGQRLSIIRKMVTLPPMFVVSSSVFKSMVEEGGIPDGKRIPWDLELEMARNFDELDSQVGRIVPSASYEYSMPPLSTISSKTNLVMSVDSLYRSYFDQEEVRTRENMGVPQFDLAVIVQKMFDPKTSGRMTQSEKDTRIVAVHGLPVELEDADAYTVNEEGELTFHAEAEQRSRWVLGEDGVMLEDMEESDWDAPKLTDKQVTRLAKMGMKILEECGEEMAVEWYLVRNTFYVPALYPTKIVVVEK